MKIARGLDYLTHKLKGIMAVLVLSSFSLQAFGLPVIAQNVVISEVMPDPIVVSDANGEWIELHNLADTPQDISGWKINDGGSNFTFPAPTSIEAYGYFVICKNNVDANANCDLQWSGMSLSNSGDTVSLVLNDDESTAIDTVTYPASSESNSVVIEGEPNAEKIYSNDDVNEYNIDSEDKDYGTPGSGSSSVDFVPTVSITSHVDGETIGPKSIIEGDASDQGSGLKSAKLSITGDVVQTLPEDELGGSTDTFSFDLSSLNLTSGNYIFTVEVEDHSGNSSTFTANLTVDSEAPEVYVNKLETNSRSPEVSGYFKGDDLETIDDLKVKINDKTYSLSNGDIEFSNDSKTWTLIQGRIAPDLKDGTYEVEATVTDEYANQSTDITNNELFVDATGPVIKVDKQKTSSRSPKITGTVKDVSKVQRIEVRIANGQWKEATYHGTDTDTWSISGYEIVDKGTTGKIDIDVRATDSLGNESYDITRDELEVISIVHAVADKVSAAFVGMVSAASTAGNGSHLDSDGDGVPDSEDETPYGEEEKDDQKDQVKDSEVASEDDSANNNWRWFLFALAVGAFLWFMFKGRQSEET